MVNDSRSSVPQVEEKKKHYTSRYVKRADCARQFHHITVQPVNQILHVVDSNILHNLPILIEDVGMDDKIYWPSVPYFQGKTVIHNIHNVETIIVNNFPKVILYRYKKVAILCDIMNINVIGFLNTIYQHIMFATGLMIKNLKVKNIEDGIKHVNNIYLQRGLHITFIHADR